MIENWIFEESTEPFLSMLAQACGGKFDNDDWIAVSHGIKDTDAEHERWFDYAFIAPQGTIKFQIARDAGTSVVLIRVAEQKTADSVKLLFAVFQQLRMISDAKDWILSRRNSDWKSVDTQRDLDDLDRQICWEDSSTIEYYAKHRSESYFPPDVVRSGHPVKNIHLLCEICSKVAPYLEVVLIGCDWFSYSSLEHMHLLGCVDSLKRIEIQDGNGSTVLRCARLIYRFLQREAVKEGFYFCNAGSILGTLRGERRPEPH